MNERWGVRKSRSTFQRRLPVLCWCWSLPANLTFWCCFWQLLTLVQQCRRLIQGIQSHSKAVVKQFWDYSSEQRTANLKAGIRVGLNQVDFEVFVNHKVVTENFKRILVSVWVNFLVNCTETISYKSLHRWEEISHEANGLLWEVHIEVTLEIVNAEFVCVFKLTIIIGVNLNSIVSQMYKAALQIGQVEGLRASTEVAVSVHEAFQKTIGRSKHRVCS